MATSIFVVTARMRAFVNRRYISAASPIRTVTPNTKAVPSRMISRTGWLFHASVARGTRNATRCPPSTTRRPMWNGMVPQKSTFPSRNCEESDETVKPFCWRR